MEREVARISELARVGREVLELRRRLVLLHVAMIAGGVVTLERVMRGVTLAGRAHFLLYWAGVLVSSLAAFALGTSLRVRLRQLLVRVGTLRRTPD
jgi:hypothetical protein